MIYVEPHVWDGLDEGLLDKFWTVDLTKEAKPLIVPFECEWEPGFDVPSKITTFENAFIRDTPGATRVVESNDNRKAYGSHIRIRAGG